MYLLQWRRDEFPPQFLAAEARGAQPSVTHSPDCFSSVAQIALLFWGNVGYRGGATHIDEYTSGAGGAKIALECYFAVSYRRLTQEKHLRDYVKWPGAITTAFI